MFLSTQYFHIVVVNRDGKEGRGSLWASLSQNWGRMACHDVTGLCIWSTLISHFFQISPDSTFGGWHLFGLGGTLHGLQGVIVGQTRCCFSVERVEFCTWWHSIWQDFFWIQVSEQFDFFAYCDILQGHQFNVSSKCFVYWVGRFAAEEKIWLHLFELIGLKPKS